jgi:hypothetical protein
LALLSDGIVPRIARRLLAKAQSNTLILFGQPALEPIVFACHFLSLRPHDARMFSPGQSCQATVHSRLTEGDVAGLGGHDGPRRVGIL